MKQIILGIVLAFCVLIGVVGLEIYTLVKANSISEQDIAWRAWRPTGNDENDDRMFGEKFKFYSENQATLWKIYKSRQGESG
uniref:Uncharacterized protein n=1 Tax=viral metagenome TaxID=1070528 RepID=A0A6H1ZLN1_9ZZZZ